MEIFLESSIRQEIQVEPQTIAIVEQGFVKLAQGDCTLPPIMRIDFPEYQGEVDVKSAYVKGYDQFAVKLSSGFFENYKQGLPSGNGLMLLIDTRTGVPRALLLDNGFLTDVRTAAAGAIAAKYLAKPKIGSAGVIGAGTQARFQMIALHQVRSFERLYVYARNEQRVQKFVKEMEEKLQMKVIQAKTAEEVVRQSDVVVTSTPAKNPIIKADWLHPGLHITAMGSDAEDKQELETEVLVQADRIVCDVRSQCIRLGELRHGVEQGLIREKNTVELGQIAQGIKPGRSHEEQITVCDLTGTGVQDTMIAMFAYERLRALGLGQSLTGKG